MASKILIVGGVAGGATALARMRRLDEFAEIILFERGPHVSYANCGLPYYIGDVIDSDAKLLLASKESFLRQYNADVRLRNEVLEIAPQAKTILVKNLETKETYSESYDYLLLSPGAKPLKPPITGIDLPGVYTLRTVDDAIAIKTAIKSGKVKAAVIIGGGFVGMEMAENLDVHGIKTTVVEMQDQILSNFDYDVAAGLAQYAHARGVGMYLGQSVTAIEKTSKGLQVSTSAGEKILADMVFMGLGVVPETALAQKAGLAVNTRGALIVNNRMQTSNPHIYAVGDAVEVCEYVTQTPAQIPLAGPANLQARIAADNMLGRTDSQYQGVQGTFIIKLFQMAAAATGLSEKVLQRMQIPYLKSYTHSHSNADYYPKAEPLDIKLLFGKTTGKILGAQVYGVKGVDKLIDIIATAMRCGMTVADLINLELAYAPPFGSAKAPVNIAGMVANNILTGDMPVFY